MDYKAEQAAAIEETLKAQLYGQLEPRANPSAVWHQL